jgi:hypothetical protein
MIVGPTARKYHLSFAYTNARCAPTRRNSRRARTAADPPALRTTATADPQTRLSARRRHSPHSPSAVSRRLEAIARRRLRTAACEGHEPPRLPAFTSRPRWAARRGAAARPAPREPERDAAIYRHFTRRRRELHEARCGSAVEALDRGGGQQRVGASAPKRRAYKAFPQPMTGGSSLRVDGKEGVAGSSPAEGSCEPAGNGGFRRGRRSAGGPHRPLWKRLEALGGDEPAAIRCGLSEARADAEGRSSGPGRCAGVDEHRRPRRRCQRRARANARGLVAICEIEVGTSRGPVRASVAQWLGPPAPRVPPCGSPPARASGSARAAPPRGRRRC